MQYATRRQRTTTTSPGKRKRAGDIPASGFSRFTARKKLTAEQSMITVEASFGKTEGDEYSPLVISRAK
jgi:hypothetical protein